MRIAYVQGSYGGAQVTGYPISLQILPLLRKLIEEGNTIDQVFPTYSYGKLIFKYFDNPARRREKLQEHFNLGVRPTDIHHESFNVKDYDKVILWACPWTDRTSYQLIELLDKFTSAGVPIMYIQSDPEFYNPNRESLIFQVLKNDHPHIYSNIRQYATCYPFGVEKLQAVTKDCEIKFIPTVYDKTFEQSVTSLTEKEFVFQFPGPLGYRETLFNQLDKVIGLKNLLSVFWNESPRESEKARKRSTTFADPVEKYSENPYVTIFFSPIYLSYPELLEFQRGSLMGFMDSTDKKNGENENNNFHTARVCNNCYSGILSLVTDTYTLRTEIEKSVYDTMCLERLSRGDLEAIVKDEELYQNTVKAQREEMDKHFSIEKWYPEYLEMIGK